MPQSLPPKQRNARVALHHHPARGRQRRSMAAGPGAARPSGARLLVSRAVSPPPPALPPHRKVPRNPAGIPPWGRPCAPLKAAWSDAHRQRDRQARSAIPRHLPTSAGNPARRPAPPPWPRHARAPRLPSHWYRKARSRHGQGRRLVPPIPQGAKRHPGRRNWIAPPLPHSRAESRQIALHHPAPTGMTEPEPFTGRELHAVIIPRRR